MIARVWHGAVPKEKAQAYYDYLLQTGIPDYQTAEGNRGIHVLKRVEGDLAHFTLITFWDSLEAIRLFAGDDVDRAKYYPEDEVFLVELEPFVTHHQVVSAYGQKDSSQWETAVGQSR